jgi:hypothetical protein
MGGPLDHPAGAERKADDLVIAVPDARDAVQGSFYPGPVVLAKPRDPPQDILKVLAGGLAGKHERLPPVPKSHARRTPEV